ncbi:heterodisulfide reductase-related iron-sulfur binding cluster [Oligoflexia bacterium]|nr:heterodisulfide reductase-related iron-sulfur binding cluster [Oligoflexia bacterium]
MNATATREIYWNLNPLPNSIAMYCLALIAFSICAVGLYRHFELIWSGKKTPGASGNYLQKLKALLVSGLLQRKVVERRDIALSHVLIYLGFLALLFATTVVFIEYDFGFRIYHGNFYLLVTLFSDVLGFGLLVGCSLAAYRRYIAKPDLIYSKSADAFALWVLVLLCAQGFALEGLRIHATNDPWALWSPVGLLVAKFLWFLSPDAVHILHFGLWWFHTITLLTVMAIFPYTKFFHIVISPLNLFFQASNAPMGALKSPGDIEKMIEEDDDFSIGLGNIKDYSRAQLLNLEACTACGRCQDACPAYASGKALSPKWMILDTLHHATALHADNKLVKSRIPKPLLKLDSWLSTNYLQKKGGLKPNEDQAGFTCQGAFRSNNELVQSAAKVLGNSADDRISSTVMTEDVFWSCTTCGACVADCPVGINHVDLIVDNRRNMVLMEGEVPTEAAKILKALENRGNPYGPAEDRTNWIGDLDVPILKAGDAVDYLYWVGCVTAFDPEKQSIAKALVTLMHSAGLSFGILGTAEKCTGDSARRLGEENLFQTLAKENIKLLQSVKFKTLVANCPHCINTIKNEYPAFGNIALEGQPAVIHHSVLLKRLLKSGQLELKDSNEAITFHDPCYLGRYENEYDAPRFTLANNSSGSLLEMEHSKAGSMCCGAGGGHFWMDLNVGERVNTMRVQEAVETKAQKIATACPFCLHMLDDGVKLLDKEDELQVKDIAELMLERLET